MPVQREQDQTELEQLLENRREGLLRFFRRSSQNPEDAEDMTQHTLSRVFQNWKNLRAKEAANAWVNQIAANVLYEWYRPHYKRELTGILNELRDEHEPDTDRTEKQLNILFSPGYVDAAETVLDKMECDRILDALRLLSPDDQALLTLVIEDNSYQEIGNILDKKPSTVAVAVKRARDRLQTLLQKQDSS